MKKDNKKPLPKVTKNEVFAWILAGLMIFWTIASVFGIIGFAHSREEKGHVISASAFSRDQIQNGQHYLVVPGDLPFNVFDETGSLILPESFFYAVQYDAKLILPDLGVVPFYFQAFLGFREDIDPGIWETIYYDCMFLSYTDAGELVVNEDFYLPINNLVDYQGVFELELTYYDGGIEEFVTVEFFIDFIELTSIYIYYNANSDIAYNNGYNKGFSEGFSSGRSQGYKDGLLANDEDIYQAGINAGYTQGLEASEKYNFMSLLSSVIDVPIQAFTSLFSFDLLGINLANFFYAIFTVCVILAVLRFIF